MEKRWEVLDPLPEDQLILRKKITEELKCSDVISELLIRKNLNTSEEIYDFFHPDLKKVNDPFLFCDMHKAADRIIHAIETQEHITIYGDYDVDGTTSTALLYLGLKRLNAIINYYIPHRMVDGYGLSLNGVDQLKLEGTSLIISVDCGINALDEVQQINSLGMEIIITDHHNPKEVLPNAYAIINPKVIDCGYPFRDLAGVGVAYKLLMAVYQKLNIATEDNINKYLDLVAVGTIADIVSLTGENRIFSSIGLQRLIARKNIGLNALMDLAGMSTKELNTTDIVFGLAPRINAAGRMGSAMRAVELMISTEDGKSMELAEIIERENSIRQQIDQKTFAEACEIIDKKYKNMADTYCMVISSDDWHPGVIGIVASKLVEKYYRPTIMISFNDGLGSGSGRSISEFDLFAALTNQDTTLESFGGHKYAAGLTILMEYIDTFENQLNQYARTVLPKEMLIPPLKIDRKIELYEINSHLMEWLDKFAPFGPDNSRPTFHTDGVTIIGYPYTVGRNHLKIKVMKDGCILDLIGFNLGDILPFLKKNSVIDIAYSLEINSWQDKVTIQGKLKDIHFEKK